MKLIMVNQNLRQEVCKKASFFVKQYNILYLKIDEFILNFRLQNKKINHLIN
jgi:hypothetical protein